MRMKFLGTILLLLLLWILGGCQEKEMSQSFPGVNVNVYKVQKQGIVKKSTLYGEITSKESVQISSKIPGTVQRVSFKNGQVVKKGDLLFRIDNKDLVSSLQQSQTGVEVAKANLGKVKSGATEQEISSLEETVNSAKVAYETAKANLERMDILYQSNAISQQQFDQAKAEAEMAEAKFKSLQHQLSQIKEGPTSETIQVSEAQLKQASANYQAAAMKVEDLTIISPLSGYISNISVDEGEFIPVGMPLAIVDDISKVYVNLQIPESLYRNFKIGQQVDVNISSLNKDFKGTVSEINPSADLRTKLFHVKILIENPSHLIKPGMTAHATAIMNNHSNAIVIPVDAIINDKGESYVYIVKDGVANRKRIVEGIRNEQTVEIADGLSEGDLIVQEGIEQLSEGEKVNIVTEKK